MTTQHIRWLSIREAALVLGVSELTIRRRIKDGKLLYRTENGKYFVDLDGITGAAPAGTARPASGVDDQADQADDHDQADQSGVIKGLDLDALLRGHIKLAEQAGRAAALQDQLQVLEARHLALQEGLVSLSNRNGWLESRLEEREEEIKLLTDSQHRPPWWKRLFGATPAGS